MTLVLGVSAFYHDSAAALLRDGEIVASAQVSLSQEPGRRVVARSQIPMERIAREPTWRSFFFYPIPGSAGQRYVIVIQAMDNDPGATTYVLGAPDNPYPEGNAVCSSTSIDADTTFQWLPTTVVARSLATG